jgi:hypothetical protein
VEITLGQVRVAAETAALGLTLVSKTSQLGILLRVLHAVRRRVWVFPVRCASPVW